MHTIHLYGRVTITGTIRAITGLHIGGSPVALEIGALDLPVVRNPVNGQPYIPGSSLKGKMRSLSEKLSGAPQNRKIDTQGRVWMHVAGGDKRDYKNGDEYKRIGAEQYRKYWVNPVFGVPGEVDFKVSGPTRLVVRDVPLKPESLEAAKDNLDMPFTEIKWENALDRVTSAASPRQIERVPAGAVFGPMELVFNLYETSDVERLGHVLTALQLVQDDYLGGHGSRGSGKVAFEEITLSCKVAPEYSQGETRPLDSFGQVEQKEEPYNRLAHLTDEAKKKVVEWVKGQFTTAFNGAK